MNNITWIWEFVLSYTLSNNNFPYVNHNQAFSQSMKRKRHFFPNVIYFHWLVHNL